MLVHLYWLSSLLSIASSTTYPTHNASISISINTTTINPTSPTTSNHQTSPTSTNSSTPAPTSIPKTFYLVTNILIPGLYLKLIPNPFPANPLHSDKALQFNYRNSTGAANFTLNDDGTLQCNSESGPLYASIPGGQFGDFILEFEHPSELDRWGLVAVNCAIYNSLLDCRLGSEKVFYYDGTDEIVELGQIGSSFLFLQVVST